MSRRRKDKNTLMEERKMEKICEKRCNEISLKSKERNIMTNQMNNAISNNMFLLPTDGCCHYKTCGDCVYMDLSDTNRYGDCYCGKKRKYYPPADSTCSNFEWK